MCRQRAGGRVCATGKGTGGRGEGGGCRCVYKSADGKRRDVQAQAAEAAATISTARVKAYAAAPAPCTALKVPLAPVNLPPAPLLKFPLHLCLLSLPLSFFISFPSPFAFLLFVQCTFGSAFIQIKHKATAHFYFTLYFPFSPTSPYPLPAFPPSFISFTYFLQQ